MKTQLFGRSSPRSLGYNLAWSNIFGALCSNIDGASAAYLLPSALKSYRENSENGDERDSSPHYYPSAGFDLFYFENSDIH